MNNSVLSSGTTSRVESEESIPAIIKPNVMGNLKRQVISVTNATMNKILYIELNWANDDNKKNGLFKY